MFEAAVPGVGFIRADQNNPVVSFQTKSTTTDIGVTSNIDNNTNPDNPYYIRWGFLLLVMASRMLGQTHW